MGAFYRSKGIKTTTLNFIIVIKAHIYMKLNFTLNNVYLSIRKTSSMHLVMFVAPTFHLIKTLKMISFGFLWSHYHGLVLKTAAEQTHRK